MKTRGADWKAIQEGEAEMIKQGEKKSDLDGRQIRGLRSGRWECFGLLLMFLGRMEVQEEVRTITLAHIRTIALSAE